MNILKSYIQNEFTETSHKIILKKDDFNYICKKYPNRIPIYNLIIKKF